MKIIGEDASYDMSYGQYGYQSAMSTEKTNTAMKNTSRKQPWSDEDQELFKTGMVGERTYSQ